MSKKTKSEHAEKLTKDQDEAIQSGSKILDKVGEYQDDALASSKESLELLNENKRLQTRLSRAEKVIEEGGKLIKEICDYGEIELINGVGEEYEQALTAYEKEE